MQSSFEQVNRWLAQLDQGNLALDDEGRCSLIGDDRFEMDIYAIPGGDSFYINIKICPLPHRQRERFFEQALLLNLFQQETLGATLAIDPQDQSMMLCYCRECEHTTQTCFTNSIDNLLETAAKLHDQLAESQAMQDEEAFMPSTIQTPHPPFTMFA